MKINIKKARQMITPSEEFSIIGNNFSLDKKEFPDILNVEKLTINGLIENKGFFIKVTGVIDISLNSACSRCLKETNINLNIPFTEEYHDIQSKEDLSKESNEEFKYYIGNEIDLEPLITELLVLELPLNQLCNENCLGLCYKCGQNLNKKDCGCNREQIDIRLLELEKFLK
ncbi:DUF177 domain-containing protein [Selenomonadales bacterium OttesenSCG-928-I06]|nr:DUF177 domain-containing protein [Selenomonadales bacterium OttesenSCG-928-I06]